MTPHLAHRTTTGPRNLLRWLLIVAACAVAAGCAGAAPVVSVPPQPAGSGPAAATPDVAQWFAVGPQSLMMNQALEWTRWHGIRLPSSDRWGPRQVRAAAATGFDHSPEGAMLAMIQQQARLAAAGDDATWLRIARATTVVAPDDQPPTRRLSIGIDTSNGLPSFAGFRWVSGTPTRAIADLALEAGDGTLTSIRVTEIWTGTDWRAELPATGNPQATPLAGLGGGYQPWPGLA